MTAQDSLKIMIAVDGSERSLRAVQYVASIARACGNLQVTLLHVAGVPPELIEHRGASRSADEAQLERGVGERTAEWRGETRDAVQSTVFGPAVAKLEPIEGVSVTTRVASVPHGRAAVGIMAELANEDYAALVIGRRERSKLKELTSGSVTQHLMHEMEGPALWVVG